MEVFFVGMALYCMFFGAGNLIFPLVVGKAAGHQTPFAIFGLALSAVAFPLLGLIAQMFFGGNLHRFLERLGKWPAFGLLLMLQITQGPLCLSRLFTLMHASVKGYFPEVTLPIGSILIALLSFFLAFRSHRIVKLLGVFLTPVFLLSLTTLVVVGIYLAPPMPIVSEGASFHFMQGLRGGYLTMDLISALLFATMVIPHIAKGTEGMSSQRAEKYIRRKMTGASCIAAGLLTLSYVGLCWLAAHHGSSLPTDIAPEDLLRAISIKVLGVWGGFVASIVVFLACLTTAISLAAVFADYLRKDLLQSRISPNGSLALTLGIAAAIANLGFSGIIHILGPMLEVLYPGLIVLCLLNIAHSLYEVKSVKIPVFVALGVAIGGFYLG